jgi:hypothetical protein
MAQIANVIDAATVSAIETVQPIPVGPLIDVEPETSVIGFTGTVSSRFPVPPSAAAFLTGVDSMIDEPMRFDGLTSPYLIMGAVFPESGYLEPTLGQIWPRTG